LDIGSTAPSLSLPDAHTGATVTDPWRDHATPTVLAFFKVTCPVCAMAAPKVQALADAGVRVVAIGEDPPPKLVQYARDRGQRVPTLTEAPPYAVSDAYELRVVPTLYAVDTDGTVVGAVQSWDRDGWNAFAISLGAPPVSDADDGLPPFRPG
jgi:thiol-disulfide isomerase/thioredoxin